MGDRRQEQICSWLEEDSGDEALDADLDGEQHRVDIIESDASNICSPHATDSEQSSDETEADISTPAPTQPRVLDLTKKWRNLKDTFKRQVSLDKKRRQGHHIKKKKYVYFKHMSFLLPHMEGPEPDGADGAEGAPARRKRARAAPEPEHIDEDHHFLMSLLPSFRRMSDDEKLSAKMDILKVIKEVRSQAAAASEPCRALQLDEPLALKEELFDASGEYDASECDHY